MTDAEKIEALREWLGNHHSPCRCMVCIELLNPIRDIIDPPKPKWRQMVTEEYDALLDEFKQPSLPTVLAAITSISWDEDEGPQDGLARIVAACEQEVGDGWQADPDSTAYGCAEQDVYDVFILLDPLANLTAPLCWKRVGDRSAAWLRAEVGE